jgi:hypothetical protein
VEDVADADKSSPNVVQSLTQRLQNANKTETSSAPGILKPEATSKLIFDFFLAMYIIVEAIYIPLAVSYEGLEEPTDYEIGGWVYNFFGILMFTFDILVNFRTAFHYYGNLVTDKALIEYHYLSGMFAIDVFATIPWDIFLWMLWVRYDPEVRAQGALKAQKAQRLRRVVRISRTVRLVRLIRIVKLMTIVKKMLQFLPVQARNNATFLLVAMKYLILLAVVSHYMACVFRLVGEQSFMSERNLAEEYGYPPPESIAECSQGGSCEFGIYGSPWMIRYGLHFDGPTTRHVYFVAYETAIAVLTGSGMNPISAGTVEERCMFIFGNLLSCLVMAYIVARFCDATNKLSEMSQELDQRKRIVDESLEAYGVPSTIRVRVKYYLMMKHEDILLQRSALVHLNLLSELMPDVRAKVFAYAYLKLFEKHGLFGTANYSLYHMLCLAAKQDHYVRGETIRDTRLEYIPIVDEDDFMPKTIGFVLKGSLRTLWAFTEFRKQNEWYDEDIFFTLDGCSYLGAPEVLAGSYVELVSFHQAESFRLFWQYPEEHSMLVDRVIWFRWRAFTYAILSVSRCAYERRKSKFKVRRTSMLLSKRTMHAHPTPVVDVDSLSNTSRESFAQERESPKDSRTLAL